MPEVDYEAIIAAMQDGVHFTARNRILNDHIGIYFDSHPELTLSTSELGEALLPKYGAGGRGKGPEARYRLFSKLQALARAGTPWAARAESVRRNKFGKEAVPWIWRRPTLKPVTPIEQVGDMTKPARYTIARLTDLKTGRPVRVKMTYVVHIEALERGARITFAFGKEIEVSEAVEVVDQYLMDLAILDADIDFAAEDALDPSEI